MVQAPFWKRALVNVLDVFTAFTAAGLLIRAFFGNSTPAVIKTASGGMEFSANVNGIGFQHTGLPALLVIGLTVGYFVVGRLFRAGTIWQRILGTREK
jgi:hypothetical protein